MQAVESAQKSKTIGTTLEARVVVRVSEDKEIRAVRKYRTELDELFVISDLTVEEAADVFGGGHERRPTRVASVAGDTAKMCGWQRGRGLPLRPLRECASRSHGRACGVK